MTALEAVVLPFPRRARRHHPRVDLRAIAARVDQACSEAELFALALRTLRSLAHQREHDACDTETYVTGLVLAHLALARLLGADPALPPPPRRKA